MSTFRDRLNKLNEEAMQPPKKKRPEVGPQVKFKCGHKRPVVMYTARLCPECNANEKVAKALAAKKEVRERNAQKPWKHGIIKKRLPAGSFFSNLLWDGEGWQGTLLIPSGKTRDWIRKGANGEEPEPPEFLTFTTTAPAVFRLLPKLDCMYRDWLENRRRERDGEKTIGEMVAGSEPEEAGPPREEERGERSV